MTDAPEKIWAAPVTDNYGEWQTSPNGLPRPTEYTRSDLVAELAAESERLKVDVGECRLVIEQQDRHAESLSRTGAVKVKALQWLDMPALNNGRKLTAIDCLGNEFARLDYISRSEERVAKFKAERQADYERRILSALSSHPRDTNTADDHDAGNVGGKPAASEHPDDIAVDRFAAAMKGKMAQKREEGRGGWEDPKVISVEELSYLLVQHIWKGDPVDVGNLAMMIQQRGGRIVIDDEARSITPEGQQPVAVLEFARNQPGNENEMPRVISCNWLPDGRYDVFTRPSEHAVTEAMVEAGARAIAETWGEEWECCCAERKGLSCDCGGAMTDERSDSYDERLSREDCRAAARAALIAALEAGG